MTVVTGNMKKPKGIFGLVTLGCVLLTGVFRAVFISSNNIKISYDAIFSKEKYPAKAFVNKRKGLLTASLSGALSSSDVSAGSQLSAKISFDASNRKVRLSLRDKKINRFHASRLLAQLAQWERNGQPVHLI